MGYTVKMMYEGMYIYKWEKTGVKVEANDFDKAWRYIFSEYRRTLI